MFLRYGPYGRTALIACHSMLEDEQEAPGGDPAWLEQLGTGASWEEAEATFHLTTYDADGLSREVTG